MVIKIPKKPFDILGRILWHGFCFSMPIMVVVGLYMIFVLDDFIGFFLMAVGGSMCVFTAMDIDELGWFAWKKDDN